MTMLAIHPMRPPTIRMSIRFTMTILLKVPAVEKLSLPFSFSPLLTYSNPRATFYG